ncbi:unnamed protein product [Porites evermanni]|uniref:Uncharacterized protein n=1 Tax=Porites evermanni TaxID=104178 RepID=A0ABN8SNZ9_9CNID|nr:unnamed protein product [Porites evermanni]
MSQSEIKAANDGDPTSTCDDEQVLNFDDSTLKTIAEVYNNEGNEAFSNNDYDNAVYFYTEGIKVNCKDKDLKAELYRNRATAHLCLGNYSETLRDLKMPLINDHTYSKQ